MKTTRVLLLVAAFLASLLPAAARGDAPERQADQTKNVKLLAHFPFENEEGDFFAGGTDIDFQGKFVYAMQQAEQGGVHIIKHSKNGKAKKLSFIPCPGEQNDVAVVKPGLIALGYHNSTCGDPGGGVKLLDVKNPKRPKMLGAVNDLPGGTHTLTVYPGKPIIYASPGGLANGGGVEQILDVSNPNKPEVAATFTPNPAGCHDLSFHISKDKKLAACAGAGETQIWDVSDPLAPQTIGHLPNPFMFFQHSAYFSHDGNLLVVTDENFGALECSGGPTGALHVWDVSNPSAPIYQSFFGIDRGPAVWATGVNDRSTWCTSHNGNFIPGTNTLVMSWYAAGMNVIDLSDPTSPQEIAHYMAEDGKSNYWSAYWYDGRIYANDRVDGLDVFEIRGLKEGKHDH